MRLNANSILRLLAWGVLAISGSGCDPFPAVDHGPLRVDRVVAVDVTFNQPPIVVENPGATATLSAVPLNYALFRIEFNKPIDGSTVEAGEPGAELCQPAANVSVTSRNLDPPSSPVEAVAQVCYSPTGLAPAIVIQPSAPTCGGPAPLGTLPPAVEWTVTATGVRDLDGHSLDFTLTVQAAPFEIASVAAETSYDDQGAPSSFALLSSAASTEAPVSRAGAPFVSDPSAVQALDTDSWYAPAGLPNGVPHYVAPVLSPAAYYGPVFDASFSALMCRPGFETLCATASSATLTGPGGKVSLGILGSSAPIPDPADPANPSVFPPPMQLVPLFPLEDGQTYTLTLAAGWTDTNGGYATGSGFTASFTTPAGTPRAVWAGPVTAPDDSGQIPATEYLTLDPGLIQSWRSGRPGTGMAFSAPIASGAAILTKAGSAGMAAGVTVAALSGDLRPRTQFFSSADPVADPLPLEPDTVYTMTGDGVTLTGASAPLSGTSYSFHTYPFELDPSFPGFVTSPWIALEEGDLGSGPTLVTYEAPSGLVYAPLAPGQTDTPLASENVPASYLAAFTGAVLHGDPVAVTDHKFEYHALAAPAGAVPASVTLEELAPDRTTVVATVDGKGGYAMVLGSDPWTAGIYPGSLVGFVPAAWLKHATDYRLTAVVYPAGADAATPPVTAQLVFTTAPFQVTSVRRKDLTVLSNGSAQVVFDDGHPLTVRTTGFVDPGALASAADPPIVLLELGAVTRQVPVTLALDGGGKYVKVIPAAGEVKPATSYTLSITSRLKTTNGAPIQASAVTFSTLDDGTSCP